MSKDIKPENTYKKNIAFNVNIGEKSCKINIIDSLHAKVDGEEILLDDIIIKDMILDLVDVFKNNKTKYNPIPKSITISHSKLNNETKNDKSKENVEISENTDYIESFEPRWNFEDIYIKKVTKKQILYSLSLIKNREKLFKNWGLKNTVRAERAIILNFYGPPGTGKTITAEAIADHLNRDLFLVNYAELESKYVGETPKNIKKIFKRARENNSILIFDEADSFLGKRLTNISQSADYGVNLTRSVLLKEIEDYKGVVIFTTNLMENYDKAFKRRILSNIKFEKPNQYGRKMIWEKLTPDELPLQDQINPELLSKKFDNITGADIRDMLLFSSVISVENNRNYITLEDLQKSHKYVINRYSKKTNDFQIISKERISEEEYKKETKNE